MTSKVAAVWSARWAHIPEVAGSNPALTIVPEETKYGDNCQGIQELNREKERIGEDMVPNAPPYLDSVGTQNQRYDASGYDRHEHLRCIACQKMALPSPPSMYLGGI